VGGFATIAIATTLLLFAAIALVVPLAAVPAQPGARASLLKVARAVWMPGFGSALSSIGLGVMIAFSSLLAAERQWHPVWLFFSAFAASLVAARLFLGHVPDRLGGARVALVSVLIEAGGLLLIWLAPAPIFGVAGALLTGLGFALVYPGLGVEAVRRAPPESRGLAMGAYTAFLDVALGFGSPALGWSGMGSVFPAAALIVFGATAIAVRLVCRPEVK
jgi:MFS family permease